MINRMDSGKVSVHVENKVFREQVNILSQQISHMLWAEAFAATLILFILWWQGNKLILVTWLLFMFVFTGIPRYLLAKYYDPNAHIEKKWEFWISILLFVTGLGWSFAGIVLFPEENNLNQILVLFLLVGIAAAANPFYSPLKKMYAIFLLPTLLPTAFYFLFKDTNYSIFTGFALLTFGILMLTTSMISSRLIENSLTLGFQNIKLTEDLIVANKVLEKLSTHDVLTGLPNRRLFSEKLYQAICNAKQLGKKIAIMFLDVDKFKTINDTLGHEIGDQVLIKFSERITKVISSASTLGRMGGDEFILLVENISDRDDAAKVAESILKALEEPILIQQHIISVTTSIGISLYPQNGEDELTLIKNADNAMYQAKKTLKGSYQFFIS